LGVQVGGDVGSAEPVDRLFRVADEEQRPVRYGVFGPLVGTRGGAAGDADGQVDLDRVGVLELVEQDPPVALAQRLADRRAVFGVAQQVAGEDQQVVELQAPVRPAGFGRVQGRCADPAGEPAQCLPRSSATARPVDIATSTPTGADRPRHHPPRARTPTGDVTGPARG
jgi:hypothetical protein